MGISTDFWRGRRVLLTGHTGFKGGWLSLWLQSLGAQVHGLALAPATEPNLFSVARVGEGMAGSRFLDIRDIDDPRKAIGQIEPEIIFHLAAQPLVRHSYVHPVETFATNVMGLVHLLESVRDAGSVRALVNVTTDKCYENREWVWPYREADPLGGHDPYSASKACAELVTAAYRRSFLQDAGIGVATARAGNVIGGGDWATDRLVPDILRSFGIGTPVRIRHPGAIRPWQHVLEPLSGYLRLAEALVAGRAEAAEAWNFGPAEDDARAVEWIVGELARLWGPGASWERDPGNHVHEAGCLRLDSSKARVSLAWSPRWSLGEALCRSVDWERRRLGGADMRAVCLEQIAEYGAWPPASP